MIKTTCERAALADRSNQHAIPTYEQPSNAHQDPSPSLIRGSMASKKNEIKMSPLIDQQRFSRARLHRYRVRLRNKLP
jgi:hypothetical protein